VADSTALVKGSSDATKLLKFEVDGFTTATTRTVTVPNKSGTMAMLDDLSGVLGALIYQGTWNATSNTPTIPAAASGNKGYYYKVATAGTTSIDGIAEWAVGDWIVSNGATWDKIDNTEAVSSVAGRTGAIVLIDSDLPPQPYDVGGFFPGVPTASVLVLLYKFPRQVVFPSGLTNSSGVAVTAATAQTDFNIVKNGSSVGTMRFAAAGTAATFIMASSTTFAVGDVLKVIAPASPDATLANIGFSLAGTR
jgi:hypothetical protein